MSATTESTEAEKNLSAVPPEPSRDELRKQLESDGRKALKDVPDHRLQLAVQRLQYWTRPEKRISIVGFTDTREEAGWDDPTIEKWICNSLGLFLPAEWKYHRIVDLHDEDTINADPKHVEFLKHTDAQVLVKKPRPEWPTSQAFPFQAVLDNFRPYFTNSISWMIALAILEGVTDLRIVGVDMAQGGPDKTGEYASQRPSCEMFVGLAEALGINVYIPTKSDLLKAPSQYGMEDDSLLRTAFLKRKKEAETRAGQFQSNLAQLETDYHAKREQLVHQLGVQQGIRDTMSYFTGVWTNPVVEKASTDPRVADQGE